MAVGIDSVVLLIHVLFFVFWLGTDIGVFRTTLDTNVPNWQPFGAGLPPVVVNRLAYNAATRQLLAATYGRGVWAISPRFAR